MDTRGNGPRIIAPVDFRTTSRAPRARRPIGRRITLALLALLAVVIAGAGWFVTTARQVEITFDPAPAHWTLEGPAPRFEISGRHVLRKGTYVVAAELAGHHALRETLVVPGGTDDRYHYTFRELPGILALTCVGADDPAAPLEDVAVTIGDTACGTTPLAEVELERGVHVVRFARERYQPLEAEIEISGFGQRQTVSFELRPDWGAVEIASRPVGAEVRVDGSRVATTPCRLEVASGTHTVELAADGFETWRRDVTVVAEQLLTMTDIVLDPARGHVVVETEPPGAAVLVDGAYAGTAPVEVEVAPDRDLVVKVAEDGFEPMERTTRVGPGATVTERFALVPQFGRVHLDVTPADAILSVDGTPVGATPSQITLSADDHVLVFTRAGYMPVERTIRPHPDVAERLTVRLQPVDRRAEAEKEIADQLEAANGYTFVRVEPGSFTMGSSRREQGRRSNETLRSIQLERPFLLGVREVTNAEFNAFDPKHRSEMFETVPLGSKDLPVVQVTWGDAARFCNWMSRQDKLPPAYVEVNGAMEPVAPMTTGYRLPTEAEWAYAARVTGKGLLKYPWGADFPPRAKEGNYADKSAETLLGLTITGYDDGFPGPAPTASFRPNAFGLFDMGGNVAEWCHDHYTTYAYDGEKVWVDPMGPKKGEHHVVRGSSWRHATIGALRLAYRDYSEEKRDDLGFRVCRYLEEPESSDEEK